uniref:X-ray repair cross-complementing protein 6 n=3 Tax=Lygus hesperus TaxID=30085 RepID=A0A0A9WZJ6_LYGHE
MSSFNYEDEEDGYEDKDGAITGKNGFVLLIDAGREMFTKTENGTTYFKKCLECVKEIFLSIARKQKMELVSVVLYRTQKSEGKHSPENVVLLQPMSYVTVSRIKRLTNILNEDCESIRSAYGHADRYVLSHALHYCQTVIQESKSKMYVKNIILFTSNDDPYPDDHKMQYQTRKQAEEFLGHHIDFDVVGLGNFDSSKFYKELVLTSRGELLKDWKNHDPTLSMSTLMSQIDRITEKFSLRHSYFWLGDDCALQMSICKLFTEPKKFRTTKISPGEMEDLQTSKVKVLADVDDDVLYEEGDAAGPSTSSEEPAKLTTFEPPAVPEVSIGQGSVPITREQVRKDLVGSAGLKLGFTLIGFVNTDDVPLYFSRGEPYLMIPASNYPNVRLVFAHLLNACLDRKKSMVGWFKLNKSSKARHVLLSPTLGGIYAEGKEHSAGFVVSTLSFSDDLMEPEEAGDTEAEPSQEQQEAADGIIKKLTIPYTVGSFSDQEVRFRTNMIEALALDLDDAEEVEDDTDADLDGIDKRLGDLSESFNNCDHLGPETSSKNGSTGNRAAKNASLGSNPIEMIQKGFANKLNIPQLKELLAQEGVQNLSAMKKAMLVSIANKRFGGPQQ